MRRMAKIMAAVAIGVASLVGHAQAQDHEAAQRSSSDMRNVTNYDFPDGSSVEGGHYGPDGSQIVVHGGHRRDTLVHPRAHYVDHLLESVENL